MLNRLRHSVRAKLIRLVDEAFDRRWQGSREELVLALRSAIADLGEKLAERQVEHSRQLERAVAEIRELELRSRRDIGAAGDRDAVATSFRFVREVMPTAPVFHHPHATLEYALDLAPDDGMALEFGVFSGQTLKIIAEARAGADVFGFDSFQGLPEDWRTHFPAGTFQSDALPVVEGAEFVIGWFEDVLPGFLDDHAGPVAFVHIDSDLYSSAKTVLERLHPRFRPGTVIIFDEYFNFPGWQEHEHRAWQEYVAHSGVRFDYRAYTANNEQVVVQITGLGAE